MSLTLDDPMEQNKTERLLAVVPVYNGYPAEIVKAVKSLIAQDFPHIRIVVIDDCSEEALHTILLKEFAAYPQVTLLRNERNLGFSKTLNRALGLVEDERYLLVLEQDCELIDNDYVSRGVGHFREEHVGVVSGENSLPPTSQLSLVKRVFVNHFCENVHDSQIVDVGFSLLKADIFRIDLLRRMGGFESSAKWKFACEEHIVSYKIRSSGFAIRKDSNLRFRAYWGRQENLVQNLRKEALYGRGLGWALAKLQSDLDVGDSEQLKSKMITRIVQAQYVTLTLFSLVLFFYFPLIAIALMISSALLHFGYLTYRAANLAGIQEKTLFIGTGFLRSWVYIPNFFLGFLYGLVQRCRDRIEPNDRKGQDRI